MKPQVVIVDEHDRVIGQKDRNARVLSDFFRVSALWLANPQSQVLIAQRHPTKKRHAAGKWGPAAAGTVEVGETYEDNIYKEAEEEIGLTGIKFRLGPKVLINNLDSSRYFCQWFTATCDWPLGRFQIQEEEVGAIEWINPENLLAEIDRGVRPYVDSARLWKKLFLKQSDL